MIKLTISKKNEELLNTNVYSFYDKQIAELKLNLATFKKYGVYLSTKFEKKIKEYPEQLFDPNKTSSRKVFLDEIKKHTENAKFFDSKKHMEKIIIMDFTRNIIYNPNSKLYVNQSCLYPSLDKTIEMIHKAGGITFLAHLYEYSQTIADNLDTIISNYSLDGIECYYPTFTTEQSIFLNNYCETHNLYKSCRSDFHGYDVKPNNHMGFSTEGKKMDKIIILKWIDKII